MSSTSKPADDTLAKALYDSNLKTQHKEIAIRNLGSNALEKLDTKTCPICYTDFPSNRISSSLPCEHDFCLSCLKDYIESKMYAFQVLDIHCPQDRCQEVFQEEHIKSILDEGRFKRYQDLVEKKKMYQNVNSERLCPKPGCARSMSLARNHDKQEQYITCACGTQICVKCWNFWHPEKSCLQVNDVEFELYAQNNDIKFCLMCKTPVARVEGCLHMTCCVCDYEWCWTCGREYTMDHDCIGFWHPSAPSIYSNISKKGEAISKFKRTLKRVAKIICNICECLVVLLLFVPALLFWPLIIMNIGRSRRRINRAPRRRLTCKIIVWSFFIGLITLPFTVAIAAIYLFLMVISIIFQVLIWLLVKIGILRNNRRRRQQGQQQLATRRWREGNVDKFAYTDFARPVQNDAVVINVQPENINNLVLQDNGNENIVGREANRRSNPDSIGDPEGMRNSSGQRSLRNNMIELEGKNINTSQSILMELPNNDVSAPLELSHLLAQENESELPHINKSMQLTLRCNVEQEPIKYSTRSA